MLISQKLFAGFLFFFSGVCKSYKVIRQSPDSWSKVIFVDNGMENACHDGIPVVKGKLYV